jgi:hypothetical protein
MPQEVITAENLDERVRMDLPDGYWSDSAPEVMQLMFPKRQGAFCLRQSLNTGRQREQIIETRAARETVPVVCAPVEAEDNTGYGGADQHDAHGHK